MSMQLKTDLDFLAMAMLCLYLKIKMINYFPLPPATKRRQYFNFKIDALDKNTKARTGIIITNHGVIETPIFMPVGTVGSVKHLLPMNYTI